MRKALRCERVILASCLAFLAVVLGSAVLVAAPAAAQAAPAQDGAQAAAASPAAVVDEPVFDAGKVAKGEAVVHDFVVRNEGDAPLRITEVRPACGCTVAEYDEVIPPGGTGKIHAELDTTDFAGGISKGLTVFTNDPQNPRLVLTIKAEIRPHVYVRPGFARFIQTQAADAGVVEQLVFTDDYEDLKILEVESPYPFLEVQHRPATEDEVDETGKGRQHVVTFTLKYGDAPVGAMADYVRLKVNHPQQGVVSIPVSGFVRPMVVLTPESAELGDFELPEDGAQLPFTLKNYAQENLKVEVDSTTLPGASAQVEEVTEGREFRVVVSLSPEMPKGPFQGVVKLKTGHPKKPVVEIPVSGTVM